MYELTTEDKELLKALETQLKTALESDYARNIGTSKMNALTALYERITGVKYPYRGSCSSCQLRLLKRVAQWVKDHVETEPPLTTKKIKNKVANKDNK